MRIDRSIKAAARDYARQRNLPLAEVVRTLLSGYVDACALENARTEPDLFGHRPQQYGQSRTD